jgi:alpha-amylase
MKKFLVILLALVLALSSCGKDGGGARVSDGYRNYYEIFVRSFYDQSGDGLGDLAGVTAKLDYIAKDVGADGIWLMPIMPSPSYHKYDITDYYAIDPQYGSLADFDTLLAEAHKRDVKVIIDLVLNHTSNLHPWFDQAVKALWNGQKSEYIDYYNFTLVNPGEGYSKITDKYYYECRFVAGMPDLNLDNPTVRTGVDGFRLDAVTSYYTGNQEKNIEFLRWLNSTVKTIKPAAYLIGEAWSDSGAIAAYYTSGIDSFFNFPYAQATGKLVSTINGRTGSNFAQALTNWNQLIKKSNPEANDALFLSNHDIARSAGFLMRNLQKEKMAAALYLLAPGNPFIYYGEELGMTGSGADPNKRLPMVWSATDKTGITLSPPGTTQSIEGLPGVDEQITDASSLLNCYKKVLAIKARHPEIARGAMAWLDTGNPGVAAYSVVYNEKTVYVLHNLLAEQQQITLNMPDLNKLVVVDYLVTDSGSPEKAGNTLTLPPMSTAILR